MSSNNLEIIDYNNLIEIEKNAVDNAKSKRQRTEENAAIRKVQGPQKDAFALGVKKGPGSALKRKRARDGEELDSDEEVDDDVDGMHVGSSWRGAIRRLGRPI